MERLPLTYDGLYYVLGLTLLLVVDEQFADLSVLVLLAGPVGVVALFNLLYALIERRRSDSVADERMQDMVESAMAWGFVALAVMLGVAATGADELAHLDALQGGVMAVVAIYSLSLLRQRGYGA